LLLIQVLYADLDRGHHLEEARRAEGGYSGAQMLRLATGEVADHVERFRTVYQHARHDPADEGVYEALVRHFADYSLAFMTGARIRTSLTPTTRSSRSSSPMGSPVLSRPGSATTL
jgi:hypothetical protein